MLRSRNMWNVWMVVMVVVLMAAASTHAAITTWNAGGDGTRWSDSGNWSGAVPGGTDTAVLWGNAEGGSTITVYIEEGDQAVNNIETFRGVVLEGTDQDDATERKLTLNGNITGVLGASSHSGTVQIKCDLELTGDTVWDVTARAGSTIAVSRVVSETVQSDITIRNTGVTSTTDSTFSADPTITGDLIILEGRTQALVTGWGSTLNSIILGDTTGDKDVVLATGNGQSIVAPIVVRAGSSGYRGIQVGHTWSGGSLTGPTIALGGDLTFVNNGPLTVSNTMSGVGGVVQNGATTIGTRLTADNTYQGDTDVTKGVLIVAGTTSGQGDYIVRADGSLTGDGQIGLASGKTVTVQSGGTLLPGNSTSTRVPLTTQSVGELTIDGDLVLLDGAELEFQLGNDVVAGTDYDTVTLLSDLTLDGTLNVTQKTGFDATTGVYTLFSGVDTLTNNGLETSGLDGIDHWIDTTQTGFVYLRTGETAPISNPIPEPAGLGLIGLALLAVRRKRRKETTVTKGLKNTWIVALVVALGLAFAPVTMAETWSGGGGDDLWSTGANWGGTAPSSGSTTALIFDGSTRLTPDQDILHGFKFNSLTFAATAGGFALTGTTNIGDPQLGLNRMELEGTAPSITCSANNNIVIQGPITANAGTNTITVDGTGSLQVPWITGASGNVVVKEGSGKLIIYEHADTQYYAQAASNVAPKLRVNDGTVEMGTRTGLNNRYVQSGSNWVADSSQAKCYYEVTVGDGVGAAQSAVLRLVDGGGALGKPLTIKSDGLVDLNGKQNYDTISGGNFTMNGGLFKAGASSILLRDGSVTTLNGDARIEGDAAKSIWLYDGATIDVDDTKTRVVIASRTYMIGSTGGPTFNVADKPGDTVDLEISGKMGAGGTGGALIKNGAGTMLIHDYSYTTAQQTVNTGTLLVTGTAGGSAGSSWLVNPNGTLGGDGIINSPTTVAGGALSPGLSAGTLTLTSLDFQDGSTLIWELGMNPTEYDTVDLVGSLTLGSTATIKLFNEYGVSVSPANQFVLFDQAPAVYATSWTFDYGTSGLSGGTIEVLDDKVVLTFGGAIPEPAGLSVVGLALMALRRKRR